MATACEKYSVPYDPPTGVDAGLPAAWLGKIAAAHASATAWLLAKPSHFLAIPLSAKRDESFRVIDAAIYGSSLYALVISLPTEWSTESECFSIRYADLGADSTETFRPLHGQGLGDIFGSGFMYEEPKRLIALGHDRFIIVAEKARQKHASLGRRPQSDCGPCDFEPGISPAVAMQAAMGTSFQIAVFKRTASDSGELVCCLEEPKPPEGANEYDLSLSSIHTHGNKLAALVKWRDRDVPRPFLVGSRGARTFADGWTVLECVCWNVTTGGIAARISFPQITRYAPNIKLLSESVLLSTVEFSPITESTTFHRLDLEDREVEQSPSLVYKAHEIPSYNSILGLRHILRDEAIDNTLDLEAGSFVPFKDLAVGGLISPDRFLLPAISAQMPFASASSLDRYLASDVNRLAPAD